MKEVFAALHVPAPAGLADGVTAENWSAQKAGHPLGPRETLTADGLCLTARKFRRHKLMELLVNKI